MKQRKPHNRRRKPVNLDDQLRQQRREIERLTTLIKDLRIKRAKPIKQTIPQLNAENARLNARIAQLERNTYDGYYEARVRLDAFAREVGPIIKGLAERLDRLMPGPWPLESNKGNPSVKE